MFGKLNNSGQFLEIREITASAYTFKEISQIWEFRSVLGIKTTLKNS